MFIHLKNVSYTYNINMPFETEALKSINLKIDKGEFIGIIGHTGCGKTTLLQLLNGLLEPTEGQVFVDSIDIHKNKQKLREIRKKIGLAFQYPENQFFEETISKEIAFGPKNIGISDIELEQRIKKSLKMVDLDYYFYKDRSPFSLSGGEMRRVAIASILAIDPEIIILDEPTASLDPQSCYKLLSVIVNLYQKYNRTIIMVSHNMEIISELTKRIIVMEKGRIVMDDTPRNIFQDSIHKLENIGLSLPQITYTMYKLKKIGKPVSSAILTVEEAKDEILRLVIKR
ncbi:MAG: energy-coupling factor transporter ATPase [Atribacterota bacterium]|nr:energy-coupling factor transporter ATPase [Atribacterota bacterium]MDD4896851.1 energy-coupling factor transporter ATPase [Atribacterota bacterium]MDD5636401.1 energy-coupling factor transporter ATPase [Atribacterota bacterium]